MNGELKILIKKMAKVGNCSYGVAMVEAKSILKDFIEEQMNVNQTQF